MVWWFGMRTKRILSLYVAAMVLLSSLFFCVSSAGAASGASFTPRLTEPAKTNQYYFDADYNLFYKYGYGMPNCTAYAYGRAYEILGTRPNLCPYNAGEWWTYNIANGFYDYGQTPKHGAIACWDNYDSNYGHVAVVEKISGKNVTFSESAYNGTMFFTQTISTDDSHMGYPGYRFLGYIYIGVFSNSSSGGQAEEPTQKMATQLWKITSDNGVNFRSNAGTSYQSLAVIPYGTNVKITETKTAGGYTWGKTIYRSQTGWCVLDYASELGVMGDLNQNGKVEISDVVVFQNYIAKKATLSATQRLLADVTGDGKCVTTDTVMIQKYIGGYLANL